MFEDFTFNKIYPPYPLKSFSCNNKIIDSFFHDHAIAHAAQLLAATYVFESDTDTVAYFSVLNDKIDIDDAKKQNFLNRLARRCKIPNKKRYNSYPSVKIGRLGVGNGYKRQGIGSAILNIVKGSFSSINNKTGCRFITVDAINAPETISFYEKNGFQFLTETDVKEDTRLMYFDLITFVSP